jgi:hypothetical protein
MATRIVPKLQGAGPFIGGGQWFASGPQSTLECHPGWGSPIRVGNVRILIISSLDPVVPRVHVSDGYHEYVPSRDIVEGGLPPQVQQPGGPPSPPATPVTLRATVARAHTSALHGSAPPITVTFESPASSPTVTLYEFEAERP